MKGKTNQPKKMNKKIFAKQNINHKTRQNKKKRLKRNLINFGKCFWALCILISFPRLFCSLARLETSLKFTKNIFFHKYIKNIQDMKLYFSSVSLNICCLLPPLMSIAWAYYDSIVVCVDSSSAHTAEYNFIT